MGEIRSGDFYEKTFSFYFTFWAVLLALFNAIVFISPGWRGYEKFSAPFWIGYIFITISFIGQLVCSYFAFKADNSKKLFYRLSLIQTSYVGLVASFVIGGLCMFFYHKVAPWVGALVCVIVLAVNILTVLKSSVAVGEIERIDKKVKTATFFIKNLAIEANVLVTVAKNDELTAEAKRVYEAIRYSDPMSDPYLAELEDKIEGQFISFADAIRAEDVDLSKEIANNLLGMLERRNQKIKLLK